MIPRSLKIKQPYRGRTLRSVFRNKIPGGGKFLNAWLDLKAQRIKASGQRRLQSGAKEGRRFLAAIPHPFCGIGHGFAEWHTAFQWAHQLNLEIAHIRLKDDWDSFFGLSDLTTYESVVKEQKPLVVRLPYAGGWSNEGKDVFPEVKAYIDSVRSDRDLLFVLADAQNAYDHVSHSGRIREQFLQHGTWQHLPRHKLEGALNVAVHLRRGDVAAMAAQQEGNWEQRYVPESWFVEAMDAVCRGLAGQRLCFHIYSQGMEADFPLVQGRSDVVFHLDAGEQETLLNMTQADVLVMSPSGFSYLAAILSKGLKVARYPWWHYLPEQLDWILLEQGKCTKLKDPKIYSPFLLKEKSL